MHIVTEVEGSRCCRRDLVILQTRPSERQDLRRCGDLKLLEQRPEISVLRFKVQFRSSGIELFLQLRDSIFRLRNAVTDRRFFIVDVAVQRRWD